MAALLNGKLDTVCCTVWLIDAINIHTINVTYILFQKCVARKAQVERNWHSGRAKPIVGNRSHRASKIVNKEPEGTTVVGGFLVRRSQARAKLLSFYHCTRVAWVTAQAARYLPEALVRALSPMHMSFVHEEKSTILNRFCVRITHWALRFSRLPPRPGWAQVPNYLQARRIKGAFSPSFFYWL